MLPPTGLMPNAGDVAPGKAGFMRPSSSGLGTSLDLDGCCVCGNRRATSKLRCRLGLGCMAVGSWPAGGMRRE